MNGRISHLLLNVNRYNEAKRFYGWLLPRLGYPNQTAYADDAPKRGGKVQRRRVRLGAGGETTFSRRPIPSASHGTLRNRLERRESSPEG